MAAPTRLIALLVGLSAAAAQPPTCRCTRPLSCWDEAPWAALNASVNGALISTLDPLELCKTEDSPACDALLQRTDDEFWLSAQAGGYQHTGQFGRWNLSASLSAYTVVARTEGDVQATVAFAARHNLRLVVKGAGHDWYGRSTAGDGALVLWTHARKGMAWDDAWSSCGMPPIPSATLQSGVQFAELFAAGQARVPPRFVVGGTCDSVGVGGCFLGGCFGTFSKLFGSAASNLLAARVVLANGSLVVANACTNPELFWSLRGGGGGLGGVVTEFTVRTHRPPAHVLLGAHRFTAVDLPAYHELMQQAVAYAKAVMAPPYGGGMDFGRSGSGYYVSFSPKGYEVNVSVGDALLAPILAFIATAAPGRFTASVAWRVWNASSGDPLPWMESQVPQHAPAGGCGGRGGHRGGARGPLPRNACLGEWNRG